MFSWVGDILTEKGLDPETAKFFLGNQKNNNEITQSNISSQLDKFENEENEIFIIASDKSNT